MSEMRGIGIGMLLVLLGCGGVVPAPHDLTPPDSGRADGSEPSDGGTDDGGTDDGGTDDGGADAGARDADTGSRPPEVLGCEEVSRESQLGAFFGGFVPGENPSRGLAVALSDRYVVFAERRDPDASGTELRLVERTGSRLSLRDTHSSSVSLPTHIGTGQLWSVGLEGGLVALDGERFALVGGRDRIELFGVEQGRLQGLDALQLEPATTIRTAAAGPNTIYACSLDGIVAYPVVEQRLQPGRGVATSHCTDLAISAELGQAAAVTLPRGIQVFSIEEEGFRLEATVRDVPGYGAVDLGPEGLLALEGGNSGQAGAVLLYDGQTFERRFELPPEASSHAVGVALMGGHVFVDWLEFGEEAVAHRMRVFGARRLDEVASSTYHRGPNRELKAVGTVTQLGVGHGLLLPRPFRLPLAWSEGRLEALGAPELGAITGLLRLDAQTVWVRGPARGRTLRLADDGLEPSEAVEAEVVAVGQERTAWLLPPVRGTSYGAGRAGERSARFDWEDARLKPGARARLGDRLVGLQGPGALIELAHDEVDFGRFELRWREWSGDVLTTRSTRSVMLDPDSVATVPVAPVFAASEQAVLLATPVFALGEPPATLYAWSTENGPTEHGRLEGTVQDAWVSRDTAVVVQAGELRAWSLTPDGWMPGERWQLPADSSVEAVLHWDGAQGLVRAVRTVGRQVLPVVVHFGLDGREGPTLEVYPQKSRTRVALPTERGYVLASQLGLTRLLPRCLR